MADQRLFEYAILLQPKEDSDGNITEQGRVLVQPTTVLSSDVTKANIIAAKSIPDDQMENLDRITVALRPF